MLKKIIRMGLPLAVALGLTLPLLNTGRAQEPQKTEGKTKKKTQKPKGKSGQRSKAEQPKAQ